MQALSKKKTGRYLYHQMDVWNPSMFWISSEAVKSKKAAPYRSSRE